MLWYDKAGDNPENGFLIFLDGVYKPVLKKYSANLRLQYFETDGYNSRIYAYENDVLYYYAIPVFFNKGYRYYLNFNYDINAKFSVWFKWSQYLFKNVNVIGSGLDEIPGNIRSEVRLMTRIIF
jgi:hypothetical protein